MAVDEKQDTKAGRARRGRGNGRAAAEPAVDRETLEELLAALRAARDGAVGVRVPARKRGLARGPERGQQLLERLAVDRRLRGGASVAAAATRTPGRGVLLLFDCHWLSLLCGG